MQIELWSDNRVVDLAGREADIGRRLQRSTSAVLVEKRVATLRFGLYASPACVRRRLPSRRLDPGDAGRHAFVSLDAQWERVPHEQWMRALGAVRFPFRSTAMAGILAAARPGLCIAALVEHDGRNAGLVRIDTSVAGPIQPMYLAYHHDLRKAPHLRAAMAAITAYCKEVLAPAARNQAKP